MNTKVLQMPYEQHVGEIKIDKNFPMPIGRYREDSGEMAAMRNAFRVMDIGDSFYWPKGNTHPYTAAKQIGARITCRKQDRGGWRVWLRQKPTH